MNARTGLVVVALVSIGSCLGEGSSLKWPEPPRQRASWRAPAGIPTNLLSAAEILFAQGFPDPRGCEYRELEVEVGNVWGGKGSPVKTRGWVLPAKAGESRRFAIAWNGVIYPATNLGGAADLHAEAMNLFRTSSRRFNAAVGEGRSVCSTQALSTRVLLLLRSGEIGAALKIWSPDPQMIARPQAQRTIPDFADSYPSNMPSMSGARQTRTERSASGEPEGYDPYLDWAGDWAWALFDHMICAHMRGDEASALATARKLSEVQPRIDAEAARRGFRRQPNFDAQRQGKEKPYLDFLDQLPQLLADLERRAREGYRVSVVEIGLTNLPTASERVAALVRDLELVQARQWSQPGSVDLAQDPIVHALIQVGDPAVEPLLDHLEQDKRLTCSVGFGREFFRGRKVLPVASAARVALQAILHADFGGGASEMRAYWNKYKGLRLEDRWYAVLHDDTAGMGRWVEAAGNITQGENVTTYPGTGLTVTAPAPTNAPIRLRGEPLRGKTNPSVTELLARRAIEIPASNPGAYDLSAGCELGLRLAAWDPAAALPAARTLTERCRTLAQYSEQKKPLLVVAKLTLFRMSAGDARAFEDYAAWLQTTTPEQFEWSLKDAVEPLCKYATNATMQAVADHMFGNTNSSWGRVPWKQNGFHDPAEFGLVQVPAFRRLLMRELDLKTPCGTVEWRQGTAAYQMTNHWGGSQGLALPESERPTAGTKVELRWCDWTAWSLANAKQIPLFNPFAPVEKRDEAIEQAKAVLDRR